MTKQKRPNVIVILSDDQGYGDFACHGNPWLKTPNLDRLNSEGVSLTDFHTSPMCAPTRAGLMSGMYPDRVGVWSTLNGRFYMRKETMAMPQTFKASGYKTAMFGKWHLGDNYPCRAVDKGFDHVLSFGGGVIGEVPDYWNNDYFDDKYLVDGKWQDFDGYCTDIWFDEAISYMTDCVADDQGPFFCYIANNAPHGPFNVDSKYSDKYLAMGVPVERARYYGMIENIDENYGKLNSSLEKLGIAEETIIVYFGDNGTSGGADMNPLGYLEEGYNAGLRGKKCDPYEGGHKNGCIIRWPEGGLSAGGELGGLSSSIDLYPTLMDLCGIDNERAIAFDGKSIAKQLKSAQSIISDRNLVIHNMQLDTPEKYKDYCVLTNEWRMIQTAAYGHNEVELYAFPEDISQMNNLAESHPDIVAKLTSVYEDWWTDMSRGYKDYTYIELGSAQERVTKLTSHTWHGSTKMSYNQVHVRDGINDGGFWVLDVLEAGSYRIELRRWPREIGTPLRGSVEAIKNKGFTHDRNEGKVYLITTAGIKIQGYTFLREASVNDSCVVFEANLARGACELDAWFNCEDGNKIGAYYCYIEKMN